MQALDQHERGSDPARLLDGEVTEVEARWACSAIKLKENAGWLVVPKTEAALEVPAAETVAPARAE